MVRLPATLFVAVIAVTFAFAIRPVVFADGEDAPKKEEAPKTDDTSIFTDYKLCKQRGTKHCRERAQFWTDRGAAGKDLLWLGRIWSRAEDHLKAAAALEKFLEFVPPKADEKAVELNGKNRPLARRDLIDEYFALREWDKSIDACEKFRADYADSAVVPETWDDQGRANRMKGDDQKALECFEKAAEKQFRAFADIIDVHLCNGDVDKAKAAVEKYAPAYDKQPDKLTWLRDMLAVVGNAAPALDKALAVAGEPAKSYDKVTVFFHWSVQSANIDRKLAKIEILRRSNSEKVNAIGIATFKKYNVETRKIDAELTEEQEAAGIRKLMEQSDQHLPPCAIVSQTFLDELKIKWDGQITVVDATGKLRYARFNEEKTYDISALEKVVKKLTEAPAGAAAPVVPPK